MPTVYKWVAAGEGDAQISSAIRIVLALACLIGALTGSLSRLIDFVLPPGYQTVKFLLAACMTQSLFYTVSEAAAIGINVQRKTSLALATAVCALAVNVLFSFMLVPKYGARGAAAANTIAFLAFCIVRTEFSARSWSSIPRKRIHTNVAVLAAAAVVTAFSSTYDGSFAVQTILWSLLFVGFAYQFRCEIRELVRLTLGIRSA
nr:polysaccharide biosynthesis C-terminal domain-containing protein [Ramlibacter agri]